MTQNIVDAALGEIRSQLLGMAKLVEESVRLSTEALQAGDGRLVEQRVLRVESQVNRMNKEVDETCVRILALQHPVAADLRLIVAIIKINSDLERMSDHAVNIVNTAVLYLERAPLKDMVDLPKMSDEVRHMVRKAIEAFISGDIHLAAEVIRQDDVVDSFKNKIFRDVIEILDAKPSEFEQGLNLILIARNLEKMADHATNIAESVIFAISGVDVRHASVLGSLSTRSKS